jgi:spore maturation protein CgeB
LYASTKVVVGDTLCPNFKYPDYWSDRIYETLGRGGFLIHPYIKGLEKEFEDKKHVVFYEYNNWNQLQDLINYYLENDKEREKIRKAGHELVKKSYTYKNRWQSILKELNV